MHNSPIGVYKFVYLISKLLKIIAFDVYLILFLTFVENKVVYRIMEEAIKLIGERLKGLRESFGYLSRRNGRDLWCHG